MKIAFIGLGIMGKPMAKNLIKAGHELFVFDRNPAANEEMKAAGANICASSADTVKNVDLVITMLPNSPQVKSVMLEEDKLADAMPKTAVFIDCSSINPVASREIAAELEKRGIDMLDAPVSGGQPKAIDGTLSFMVGGKEEVFNRFKPVLASMGSSVVLCGGIGAGNVTKLCNQTIVAVNIAVLAEAMQMGQMCGVEPQKIFEAIRGGLAGSTVMNAKAPMMMDQNFEPGFRIDLHIKDLKNVVDAASAVDAPIPLTQAVLEMMTVLHKDGCEEYNKDLTGLIHDVPTACADLELVESYIAARFFEEFYADMSAEEEDVEIYHKEDAIGVRNCFVHLKKTLSALHENGGTLEEAKKYLLMPMDERSTVIDEQGGNSLALSYCFVSPALAVAMTAREFGVDFWALWDELGADIPSVERFPAPQPCPPVEPVSTQELFGVAPDDMAYYWWSDGKVQFSDEMTAWMQSLRAEMDGITDTIPPEKFLQAMVDAIAGAGNYAFRDMFYEFIARQAEPRVQAAVLLLERLVGRGELNIRRYLAILGNPALREKVFGF